MEHNMSIPIAQDGWVLRHTGSKRAVTLAETVTCFRGEKDTILGGRPPLHDGSTGRVWTDRGEFFPSVFNLEWYHTSAGLSWTVE